MSDLRFGCPYCGASSGETCISQGDGSDMPFNHGERILFAAVHDRSVNTSPAASSKGSAS